MQLLTLMTATKLLSFKSGSAFNLLLDTDGTPNINRSINGSNNATTAEVVTEYISTVQWLLPLGLSVAGVLVAAILIFTALKVQYVNHISWLPVDLSSTPWYDRRPG